MKKLTTPFDLQILRIANFLARGSHGGKYFAVTTPHFLSIFSSSYEEDTFSRADTFARDINLDFSQTVLHKNTRK